MLKLIAGHIISDFFLQSDFITKPKYQSLISLGVHALINALSVYIIILWTFSLWWIILAVFITHFFIDYAKWFSQIRLLTYASWQ